MSPTTTYRRCLAERSSDALWIREAEQILGRMAKSMHRLQFSPDKAAFADFRIRGVPVALVIWDQRPNDILAQTRHLDHGYTIDINFRKVVRNAHGARIRFLDYYNAQDIDGMRSWMSELLSHHTDAKKWVLHEIIHVLGFIEGHVYSSSYGYSDNHMELSAHLSQEVYAHVQEAQESSDPLEYLGRTPREFVSKMWDRILTNTAIGNMPREVWQRLVKRLYTNYAEVVASLGKRRTYLANMGKRGLGNLSGENHLASLVSAKSKRGKSNSSSTSRK